MRNFRHALFDPGFATTRYNTLGYGHAGYDFIPGSPSWGVRSADTVGQFGPRATKEMEYFPVKTAPIVIQVLFYGIKKAHMKSYNTYIRITSLLVIIAWLAACLGVLSHVFSHRKFFQRIKNIGTDRLIAPIIAASALVVYEGLVTSVFCQPVYRYFHLTEPLRLVVAGFGAVFLTYLISSWFVWKNSNINKSINWSRVESILLNHYTIGASSEGADAYPPLLLFKCLLLQKWFHINSDPELENQINDRLSFKKFLSLPFGKPAPDHSTYSRFRSRLPKKAMDQ